MTEKLEYICIEKIHFSQYQPRKFFDSEGLLELAASIKEVGMIQPPIVKKIDADNFELVAGERRLRAAKLIGMKEIPAIVKSITDLASAEAALIENIQRVDLNPIETANAIQKLMSEFQINQEEVSLKVGKKRSTIANYLRLLSLPTEVQQAIIEGKISMGHAKAILSLPNEEERQALLKKIVHQQLSVRHAEKWAKQPIPDVNVLKLVEELQQLFGTKVSIVERKKHQGQLCIDYYSLDDLDRILNIFRKDSVE